MLSSAPTPVALSETAEVERQDQVAQALAQLLNSADAQVAALTAALRSPDEEVQAWTEELELLRCAVHLGDLDACRSQHRLFSISFATTCDPALREQEMDLLGAPEIERRDFFSSLYKRMRDGDFSGFNFTEDDYKQALEDERAARAAKVENAAERIRELQAICLPAFQQRLAEAADVVGGFPWHSITASGDLRWRTNTDALTLESSDDLWVVSQAWPSAPCASVTSGHVTMDSAERLHHDVLLVVDLSGSMCSILPILKECLQDIIAHTSDGDRMCVIGFNSEPTLLCDWAELDQDLTGDSARGNLCSCVDAMNAKGGTRLVPALRLVSEQLHRRTSPKSEGPRSTAMVLLSDGDPEEPPEALSSAAAHAFKADGCEAPLVIALALGDESRPDLMALLAQCGCGASLYIAGRDQLPSQLGRMWGILGERAASDRNDHSSNQGSLAGKEASLATPPTDAFLVLEPADGACVLETERSPGGTVSLTTGNGRQLVVLRCGRHSPPGDEGACCRLASRLRLPAWARSPIDSADLERPLLRSTWIWHDSQGSVFAASDVLRAVQVPALLIEARTGLPLRVVLGVDSKDCDNFDRERFLSALANALGVEDGRLALGRVSPGSIITDLHLLTPDVMDMFKLRAACSTLSQPVVKALAEHGFDAATVLLPGGKALCRVLQWRLAAALEAAAACAPEARGALDAVAALASSASVQMYDCDTDPGSGGAAAIAADAARAAKTLEAATAAGMSGDALARSMHLLEQQAHAHSQQLCPELSPDADSVRCYEDEQLRVASVAFQTNADIRETAPPPAAPLMSAMESGEDGLSICVRSGDTGASAAAVTSLKFTIHYGNQSIDTQISVPAGKVASPQGVRVALPAVESGAEHAVVAMVSNGRAWGEQSVPLLCRLYGGAAIAGIQSNGKSPLHGSRKAKTHRASSLVRSGHVTNVVEASATALGTLSLRWESVPQAHPDVRWEVHVDALSGAPQDQQFNADHLVDGHSGFVGLVPSATYRFRISAKLQQSGMPIASVPESAHVGMGSLLVTGQRMGSTATTVPLPRAVEGLIVVPPFAKGVVARLEADPALQPLALPGSFIRLAGSHSRNA